MRLVVGLVTTPLLIRLLGVSEYGVWAILNATVTIVAITELEVSSALRFFLAADAATSDAENARKDLAASFAIVTVLGLAAAAALLFAGPALGRLLFHDSHQAGEAGRVFQVFAFTFLPRFWQKWGAAAEAAFLRYDLQLSVELPVALLVQIASVGAALIWPNALAVAISQSALIVVAAVAHFFVLRRIWRFGNVALWPVSVPHARRILGFALADWITTVGATVFNNADRVVVNGVLGTATAGLYSAAITVVNKIVDVPSSFIRVLPPSISAAHATGNAARIRHLLWQAVRVNGVISFLSAAGVVFWAGPISVLMVGAAHAAALAPALRILAAIYGLNSLCITAFWFAGGIGRPIVNGRWALLGGVLMCFAIRELGSAYGLSGAAWGNAAYLLTAAVTFEVARMLHLRMDEVAHRFAPSVASVVLSWVVASSRFYSQLGMLAQGAVYAVLNIPLVVWIVGPQNLVEWVNDALRLMRGRAGRIVEAGIES
jgi:O-antigen/teichoic acid export membrane protein